MSGQTNIIPFAVVQTPSAFVLEPIFEFDFRDQLRTQLDKVDENEENRKVLDSKERKQVALLEHWRAFHRIDHLGTDLLLRSQLPTFRSFREIIT